MKACQNSTKLEQGISNCGIFDIVPQHHSTAVALLDADIRQPPSERIAIAVQLVVGQDLALVP
jgi:hypothetical protein